MSQRPVVATVRKSHSFQRIISEREWCEFCGTVKLCAGSRRREHWSFLVLGGDEQDEEPPCFDLSKPRDAAERASIDRIIARSKVTK